MNNFLRQKGAILAIVFFIIPAAVRADCPPGSPININTADSNTLESLQHIGSATAQKIINYRQNTPFVTTLDIRKASTYITQTYYDDIAACITVGNSNSTAASSTATTTATSTSDASASGGAPAYVPPPPLLVVDLGASRTAFVDVPLALSASVKAKSGALDLAARVAWSFGDGSAGEGRFVEKTYRYAGAYLVVATATDGPTIAHGEMLVTVKPAVVRIASVSGEGITLANDSGDRLDLSGWRLSSGTGIFTIPLGMSLLPSASVFLPSTITNLPIASDAALMYPSGRIAAQYVPATESAVAPEAIVQPMTVPAGSSQVQAVEPFISTTVSVPTHVEAVNAPAAATELAAAGAASASSSQSVAAKPAFNLLRSPWTLGLAGIIALVGGAFILL